MKTLKKTLSLTLVFALVFSLMSMAFAAETTTTSTTTTPTVAKSITFTDQSSIKNPQAVQTNVALNIINGRDDGTFDPTGVVKRSEMAKMITIALNGGVAPTLGTKPAPTYTDIKGHWAESYIEYCTNLGIISGMGDGTFAPDASVTGVQAAKMLLVALGYKSEYEGYTGAAWALNVNTRAMQKGIYENLAIDPDAGLSRDNAAQMVYNALYAEMVRYTYGIAPGGGSVTGVAQAVDTGETMLRKCYKLVETDGKLTGISYDSTKSVYTYTLQSGATFVSKEDFSGVYGMNVTVFWKDKVSGGVFNPAEDTVYDIVPNNSTLVAKGNNGYFGKYDTAKGTLEFMLKEYKCVAGSGAINVYQGYNHANGGVLTPVGTMTAAASLIAPVISGTTPTYDVRLIDNNNDGKIDEIVALPFAVTGVTFVGKDSVSFRGLASVDSEDLISYDGIAKDDLVAYYPAASALKSDITVVKQNVLTGKVTGVKTGMFQVNGMWMLPGTGVTMPGNNDTIAYVAVGALAPFVKIVDNAATSKDVLVIYQAATNNISTGVNNGTFSTDAKVIFADGTKKTVTISKVNGTALANTTAGTDLGIVSPFIGQMVTYVVDKDGDYEITALAADNSSAAINPNANYAGYEGVGTNVPYNNKTVGGVELADDAIVFVVKGAEGSASASNDAKVYSGKEIKNAYGAGAFGTANEAQVLYKKVDGFNYTKVAVICSTVFPTINTGSNYGYLTADAYKTIEDGDTYINYTMWTAKGEVKVKEKHTKALTPYVAGTIVTYDTVGEGLAKNVSIPAVVTSAVTGYDENTGKIAIQGFGNSKVDKDDTTVIFVNSAKKAGAEGAIATADYINGAYRNNVRYIGNNTVMNLVVVDVNNDMATLPGSVSVKSANFANARLVGSDLYVDVAGNLTPATVAGYLDVTTGATVTVNAASTNVAANETITVKFASGETKTLTIKQGTKLTLVGTTLAAGSSGDGAYTVAFKLGTTTIASNQIVAPTDEVTVEATWTGTDITGTKDTVTVTPSVMTTPTAVVTIDFPAATFASNVTKTATITGFTGNAGTLTATSAHTA